MHIFFPRLFTFCTSAFVRQILYVWTTNFHIIFYPWFNQNMQVPLSGEYPQVCLLTWCYRWYLVVRQQIWRCLGLHDIKLLLQVLDIPGWEILLFIWLLPKTVLIFTTNVCYCRLFKGYLRENVMEMRQIKSKKYMLNILYFLKTFKLLCF